MPLKIAIQMDAIEQVNITGDTTFALALEAQRRGHELYYYQPQQMRLENSEVVADIQPISLQAVAGDHFTLQEIRKVALKQMDVVLMRQDPPFDMNYLTYAYMLERIHPDTLVVNNPAEVRNCPEKLFVCEFKEFMPPTLIAADRQAFHEFHQQHGAIVVKPLYAHGGADVYKIDNNLDEVLDDLLQKYNTPIIAQQFLPQVLQGDKRIILINGEAVGAVNRIPEDGSIRSNFAQGGAGEKAELTAREQEICAALKPELQKRGLILAGIDVIDGYLTEINVTSPTGIQIINKLDNVCLEALFWDFVERL